MSMSGPSLDPGRPVPQDELAISRKTVGVCGRGLMNAELVKQQVRQFREKTAHTGSEAHSFAPWYLHFRYHLSETQAMQQASDGNYDFGVDGFHLQYRDEGNPP